MSLRKQQKALRALTRKNEVAAAIVPRPLSEAVQWKLSVVENGNTVTLRKRGFSKRERTANAFLLCVIVSLGMTVLAGGVYLGKGHTLGMIAFFGGQLWAVITALVWAGMQPVTQAEDLLFADIRRGTLTFGSHEHRTTSAALRQVDVSLWDAQNTYFQLLLDSDKGQPELVFFSIDSPARAARKFAALTGIPFSRVRFTGRRSISHRDWNAIREEAGA